MARKSHYDDMPAVVLASASAVNFAHEDPQDLSAKAKRVGHHFAWQREAQRYEFILGEIWFAHAWVGNAMSRIRWEIGLGPDRDEVRDNETEQPLPEVDVGALEAAETALGALQGRAGTQSEWARAVGSSLSSQAETYLIGHAVNDDFDPVPAEIGGLPNADAVGETWEGYAATSVEKRPTTRPTKPGQLAYFVQRSQNGDWTELPPDATGVRIWRRGSAFPDDASGPMRALLNTCRRLDIVDRGIEANLLSRIPAGVLLIPQEGLGLQTPQVLQYANPGQEGPPPNPVITEFVAGMATPINDSASGFQFIPTPISTKAEFIDKWKLLSFARQVDPEAAKLAERLIRRIATGLDMPPEVLLGLGDMTHWNAWIVSENSFREHLAPQAQLIADGLTVGYLWPAMRATGIDRNLCRTLYVKANPIDLVSHPDRSLEAEKAFDRGAISWAALREYKDFEETDAPTPEELLERVEYGFIPHGRAALQPVSAGSTPGETGNASVTPGPPSTGGDVVAASAVPSGAFVLSAGQIECAHLRDVLVAADGAVDHALDKARNKLRSWANGDPVLKATLTKAPNDAVPILLGRSNVDSLVAAKGGYAALLGGTLDGLVARYRRLTADAQQAWRDLVASTYGVTFDAEDVARMTADALASEAVLEQGVAALAAARLLDPDAHLVTDGEQPSGVTIPSSVVRRATARAGGAVVPAGVAPLGEHVGGLCSGATATALLGVRGLRSVGTTWVYGTAPRRGVFEAHRQRDGAVLNGDGHHPGECAGCCCSAVTTWERT